MGVQIKEKLEKKWYGRDLKFALEANCMFSAINQILCGSSSDFQEFFVDYIAIDSDPESCSGPPSCSSARSIGLSDLKYHCLILEVAIVRSPLRLPLLGFIFHP